MGDSANKTQKVGFFTRVRAELKKIIWPDKMTILRQTVAVVLVSVALGAIIKVLDLAVQYVFSFIFNI
ncbi:MAG: preprotein translocase subunit SecE [Lachnospiraceae bacterium]|nr:preprotein translocase subunit SecE [Lachnospiraceae bacterium]